MTGYTVHTGSTVKFAQGWDEIFGNAQKRAKSPQKKTSKSKTATNRKKTTGKKKKK